MDPYIDIIPDELRNGIGEKIRKRVRDRDSDEEAHSSPSKRSRADTSTLLLPEGDADIEEPPQPEENLADYSRERLQKGLRYVNGAVKRNITPRTIAFLRLHKDALKKALDLDIDTPKESAQAVVQAYDQAYNSAAFYLKPRSVEEHQRLQHYVKLREIEILMVYGDYLGQVLQDFRADLKEAAKPEPQSSDIVKAATQLGPPKTWHTIADEMAGTDILGLRNDLYWACLKLGLDSEHMAWLIERWADRNRRFHNRVREYITDCDWPALAERLCRDLKELGNVISDPAEVVRYEAVLTMLKDKYFQAHDRDNPVTWIPSKGAQEMTLEMIEKKKKKALRALEKFGVTSAANQ